MNNDCSTLTPKKKHTKKCSVVLYVSVRRDEVKKDKENHEVRLSVGCSALFCLMKFTSSILVS